MATEVPYDQRSPVHHLLHNFRLIASAFFLSLCFFTYGFDGSVIGGVYAMPAFIADFSNPLNLALPARDVSIMTAVPVPGAVAGTLLAAWLGDKYGRKKALWVACLISLVGAAIQTGAINVAMLTVGRTIAYGAAFMMLALAGAFQTELAPTRIRGAMVSLSIISINLASVLTSGVNWATHGITSSLSYRLPIGLQCLWPIIIAAGLLFVVDSPTFFLIKGNEAKARSSLRQVRQGYTEQEIEVEMAVLKHQANLSADENKVAWIDMFRGSNLRRTLLAMSVANMQLLSGIAFATNYATIFLAQVGTADPFLLTLALNILSLGGSFAGLFLVDWVGRRTLALTTFIALLIINSVIGGLGFADKTNPTVIRVIAAFCLMFGFFYASGFGPLAYVVTAEMPTARLRNITSAFSFMTAAVFAMVIAFVLPYLANTDELNLGAKTYLVFAVWMAGCIIVTYFTLPETRGRTPAELDEMFAIGVPARAFKAYICRVDTAHVAAEETKQSIIKSSHEERNDTV
ncbi:hypothetical protein FOXG_15085 [Fusarium oxysporum f. sp. lycopersici 4287]|uniref:Major facilitator superfamily (MFS) profile domain-containing protein n=3 Tax=Fusarium oxysporum TaxID=5507 RepID=A0A0J9W0J6_FUSO4|nr:hypothetical protein FOXG_14395 [Fusarium oxysporum f. sp. lycopersici 4287]XP_018255631.1 hypothetical protein FOXG_15085 [Fusarium oxysporum f. sp. lycopersici 4287]EXK24402.1 hypothetical protein FOMG_18864 [Fusarium oxysporum f. sp. melonis 26406]KAJ9413307.1 general substrate transporter [Fusarium oxysporum]KNB16568.1 hypothetical protein FOXG_14395 [Fusarium oxysporum f. sp. lycopersici 4287]KNB17586.1 hypothetical protein FOXG_15085 [Fusarium oxysporum f. sp. lycopersici 4287]